MDTLFSQRWDRGDSRWVDKHVYFDPKAHDVVVIEESTAKEFIKRHHYSGTYPAARYRVGLVSDEGLVGACVFSVPWTHVTNRYVSDVNTKQCVELGRLVLLDYVGFNAESWFVSRAFKFVKRALDIRFILSFSDPVERRTLEGQVVKPGHVGQVYQALNADFFGRASPAYMMLLPDGRVMNPRTLGKLRRDESGYKYVERQLVEAGAPARRDDESGKAYIDRIKPLFRRLRHPGNLAYGWSLDKHVTTRLAKEAYVKLA
jgi:hypothetical protein